MGRRVKISHSEPAQTIKVPDWMNINQENYTRFNTTVMCEAYANEDLKKFMIQTVCTMVCKVVPAWGLIRDSVYNGCGPLSWAVWQHMAKEQGCEGFDSPVEPVIAPIKRVWCAALDKAKDQGPII